MGRKGPFTKHFMLDISSRALISHGSIWPSYLPNKQALGKHSIMTLLYHWMRLPLSQGLLHSNCYQTSKSSDACLYLLNKIWIWMKQAAGLFIFLHTDISFLFLPKCRCSYTWAIFISICACIDVKYEGFPEHRVTWNYFVYYDVNVEDFWRTWLKHD